MGEPITFDPMRLGVDEKDVPPSPIDQLSKMFVPAAARTFVGTVLGDRRPITEQSFTPQELEILRSAIDKRGASGVIGYGDYGEKNPWSSGSSAVLSALSDPAHSMAFTLGMANVETAPDGSHIVSDNYDFGASRDEAQRYGALESLLQGLSSNGLLGLGNALGNMFVPKGEGRPVRIVLPPITQETK
jgi:hypothetical protein